MEISSIRHIEGCENYAEIERRQTPQFAICWLFLARYAEAAGKVALRLIRCGKKCTFFSNSGAACRHAPRQSPRMKTEEKPVRTKPTGIALKRILVPIDFSPLSKKALQYALRFAEEFRAGITLLHVIEPDVPPAFDGFMIAPSISPNGDGTKCANRLKVLASSMAIRATNYVEPTVRIGHAPNEITKAAKDLDVDLIIIATHGYTSWRHLCIGSTAERVVRTAPCPVLVVREKEHEFI
jgi:universal stress protein A